MPETINIKLPDGSEKSLPKGATALDVASAISPRLASAALAAKVDGTVVDLNRPIEQDAEVRILTEKDPESLEVFRHSSAHVLATAVLELFPETKLGHGPPTESGFFYDFYRPTPFTPEDLIKLEARMQEIVKRDDKFVREYQPRPLQGGRRLDEGALHRKVHRRRRQGFFLPQWQLRGFLPRSARPLHRAHQGL